MSQQKRDIPDTVGGEPVTEVQEATDTVKPEELRRAQQEKVERDEQEAQEEEESSSP